MSDRKPKSFTIRPATTDDAAAIWTILEPIIRGGEVYAFPRDMSRESALAAWMNSNQETFVAEQEDQIVGTYYLRANKPGGGSHVANCGYATDQRFRGRGVARSMCQHSIERATARGFRAVQFNFVVSTNEVAVRLWKSLGFEIVGTLPEAFAHPQHGFVDVYVMFRRLS